MGKSTQLSFEYAEDGEHDTGKGPIIKRGRQLTRNLFTKATFHRAFGSVVNADCRSWDIRNLWICDGSVFPTVGGVNPSLTIQAIACRTADRIRTMAARGELERPARP